MHKPVIISTWSFAKRGHDKAWPALIKGGSSLDAVEKVCEAVELDPQVDSVGFGGLPDSTGRVSLDGCIMLAPDRCGSVCHLRRFMHPVSIARRVMEKTGHVMLAGDGADAFAQDEGFLPADLLSADAQDKYQRWIRDQNKAGEESGKKYVGPRPIDRAEGGRLFYHPAPEPESPGQSKWKHHDTVSVLALDSAGVLAGACSTSGLPFKMPGRVGDSPIIGHGLYVDPKYGAAAATGAGELLMGVCGSFLAVELMRRGAKPLDALRDVLQRIIDSYELCPEHQVGMIALSPSGDYASAALRDGYKTSLTTSAGSHVIDPDAVMMK